MTHQEMSELAIEAKNNGEAFEKILGYVDPMCRRVAWQYSSLSWMLDRDDVYQWALIEVWNSVRTFEANHNRSFLSYCKMTVINHIRSRIRRVYGKNNLVNLYAARLDMPLQMDDGDVVEFSRFEYDVEKKPTGVEQQVVLNDFTEGIWQLINNQQNLTKLEYNCLILYYVEQYSHEEIQYTLQLVSRKSVDNALARVRKKLAKNSQLQAMYQERTS